MYVAASYIIFFPFAFYLLSYHFLAIVCLLFKVTCDIVMRSAFRVSPALHLGIAEVSAKITGPNGNQDKLFNHYSLAVLILY